MSIQSERVKKWRRETKKRIIKSMGEKCIICKYDKKCSAAYDLHHVNPNEKEFGISSIARKSASSWSKICEELRKCVLLCCRCHREIHAGLINLPKNYPIFDEKYADYKSLKKTIEKSEQKTTRKNHCECGKEIDLKSKRCNKCYSPKTKIQWPSVEDLLKMTEETNYVQVGKILGVSDNAVRKRISKMKKIILGKTQDEIYNTEKKIQFPEIDWNVFFVIERGDHFDFPIFTFSTTPQAPEYALKVKCLKLGDLNILEYCNTISIGSQIQCEYEDGFLYFSIKNKDKNSFVIKQIKFAIENLKKELQEKNLLNE